MKLKVPIILGIVIIILFVICLFMNRDTQENFTSLIGTANNNYSTKENLIDGLYSPVNSDFSKFTYKPYSLTILSKGNRVIFMFQNRTPKSELGEPCLTNSDCTSELCDTTGKYNARGACVINDALNTNTGLVNTNGETEYIKFVIYKDTSNQLRRYNTKTYENTILKTNIKGLDATTANYIFYKNNSNELYRYNVTGNSETKLGSSLKHNLSAVSDNCIFWIANSNKQVWVWDGSNTTGTGVTNIRLIRAVNPNCFWYRTTGNVLGRAIKSNGTWSNTTYTNITNCYGIHPSSENICYYKCVTGKYYDYEYKGCYKDGGFTCPPGYTVKNESTGTCRKSWTSSCGESCAKNLCTSNGGTWIPLDYSSNPYTCQMPRERDLPTLFGRNKSLSQCNVLTRDSKKYFGRQYTGTCWGGNSYGKFGTSESCNDCDSLNVGSWKQCIYENTSISCNNTIFKFDATTQEKTNTGVNKVLRFMTYNDNGFYYQKYSEGNKFYRYTDGTTKIMNVPQAKKMYVDGTDLYVAGYSTRTLYKVNNPLSSGYINASKYPSNSNSIASLKKFVIVNGYNMPIVSEEAYLSNNKNNFYGYNLFHGVFKYRKNGERYIKLMTTSFYNKNTSDYLKNLFEKDDILKLIHKDNSLYIQNERNYMTFKRIKKLNTDVLNFDQIENRNLQYNINQMETPQLQVASELCPLGTHKCYDEDANALFCGYQESGFVPGEVPNCKSGSQYCALDEENSNGMNMCDPNIKISTTSTTLPMIPSLLNTKFYGRRRNFTVNCNYLVNQLINNGLNNLTIITRVKNKNNKSVFKSLGVQFFNPGQHGSDMILNDSPLTNLLNTSPNQSSFASTASQGLYAFIGLLLILVTLEELDVQFLIDCRNQILKNQYCGNDSSETSQLQTVCNNILNDVDDVKAEIDNMEITQFKLEKMAQGMTKGPNLCSFYLKSYKSYSKLEPNYYCTGHTNGDTSMSLVKGGHINSITVQGKTNQNQSQLWYFEDAGSFIINKPNLKVFRTFIRSQNGLYLEPSFGEIQGFSRMGGHDVYKVNLVRKPTRYWFIVGTKFNSEIVGQLNREITNMVINENTASSDNYIYNCEEQ